MFGMRGQKWINLTGNIVYQYSIPEFMGRQQTTGIDFRWFTSKEQFDEHWTGIGFNECDFFYENHFKFYDYKKKTKNQLQIQL